MPPEYHGSAVQARIPPDDSCYWRRYAPGDMSTLGNEFGTLLGQYNEQWLEQLSRLDERLQLLRILKQGVELLLLVSSFLLYYLTDCIAQVLAMPIPFVR